MSAWWIVPAVASLVGVVGLLGALVVVDDEARRLRRGLRRLDDVRSRLEELTRRAAELRAR